LPIAPCGALFFRLYACARLRESNWLNGQAARRKAQSESNRWQSPEPANGKPIEAAWWHGGRLNTWDSACNRVALHFATQQNHAWRHGITKKSVGWLAGQRAHGGVSLIGANLSHIRSG